MALSSALRAIGILVAHAAFEAIGVGRDAIRLAGGTRCRHALLRRVARAGAALAGLALAILRRTETQPVACAQILAGDAAGLYRACAEHRRQGAGHYNSACHWTASSERPSRS